MFVPTCTEPTVPATPCCTPGEAGCLEGAVFMALDAYDVLADVQAALTPATISAHIRAGYDAEVTAADLMALAGV